MTLDRVSRRDLLRGSACCLAGIGAGCSEVMKTGRKNANSSNRTVPNRQTSNTDQRSKPPPSRQEAPSTENDPTEARASPPEPPIDTENMTPVLDDSFLDGSLDTSTWRNKYPWNSRTHNYDGYASPENVRVVSDTLVLKAERERRNGKPYTTGVISTKRVLRPGYYEASIKIPPTNPGFWPAFWLTSASEWPPEIDIFEFFGSDPRVWMTYHYYNSNSDRNGKIRDTYSGTDFSDRFHRYGVDWRPERITWYIDGIERFQYAGKFLKLEYMWMILNFGIGAPFLKRPRPEDLPATYEVEWVRGWEY